MQNVFSFNNTCNYLKFAHDIVTTLEQVATVDYLTSPNGMPRGNHSKSSLVYLVYHGRPSVSIRVYQRAIAIVTLSDKCGNQR